jgi:hypothetical protein
MSCTRHREEKLSEFCKETQSAPHLLIVLEMLMLVLMLTTNKLEACSPALYSYIVSKSRSSSEYEHK